VTTKPTSFTMSSNGIANQLLSRVTIGRAFGSAKPPKDVIPITFNAIWDTGATNTVITKKVVKQCSLRPTGRVNVQDVRGSSETDTYIVSIMLPNHVGFRGMVVTKGKVFGADVLIGMDIMNGGDFAVTNKNGKTVFSYRFPSMERIDFVRQLFKN